MAISGSLQEEFFRSLEDIKTIPLKEGAEVSIAAVGTGTATITIPADFRFHIKSWVITKGANVTVTSIAVDDNNTYLIAALADVIPEYGGLLIADKTITISGSNTGAAAETLRIDIKGFKDLIVTK